MVTLAAEKTCTTLPAQTKVHSIIFPHQQSKFLTERPHLRTGYYVQINSEDEARRRVIEYALVMARPMVLYQADHPIHWSHVFVGGLSRMNSGKNENAQRLFTTVSTPVYDRRNTSVRVANLLGVVGTDVPIEDIKKMVPQYKVIFYEI